MEPVFYNNKEFGEILHQIEKLMQEAEQSPFQQTKELVTSILQYFDLMHREPLARMMKMIESEHPELRTKMETDYTIKTLFSLYDLMEGEIERNPMDNPNTLGFVPVENVGLFPSVSNKLEKKNGEL